MLYVLQNMKGLIAVTALMAILPCCGSKPSNSKPSQTEITGHWECTQFPEGFIRQVGSNTTNPISSLSIRDDGSISARSFPARSPYRFIDIDGTWEIAEPSMTPSGSWSVEFQGQHLQCRRNGDHLVLRYTISGKDNYSVEYQKAEQDAAPN